MRKTLLIVVLFSIAGSVHADEEFFLKIEHGHLRSAPALDGLLVHKLRYGDHLHKRDEKGDWYFVEKRFGAGWVNVNTIMDKESFLETIRGLADLPPRLVWVLLTDYVEKGDSRMILETFLRLETAEAGPSIFEDIGPWPTHGIAAWFLILEKHWPKFPNQRPGSSDLRRLESFIDKTVDRVEYGKVKAMMLFMKAQLRSEACDFETALKVCSRIIMDHPHESWRALGEMGDAYDISRVRALAYAIGIIDQGNREPIWKMFEENAEKAEDPLSRSTFRHIVSEWQQYALWVPKRSFIEGQ